MPELMFPKHPRVEKRKYLDYQHNQPCTVSGYERSDMGGPDVEPAHLNSGNYARSMKASDWHTLPLVHDQHREHDKNPERFWLDAFTVNEVLMMDMVKGYAKWRYLRWVLDTGRDVEAAVREIARDD